MGMRRRLAQQCPSDGTNVLAKIKRVFPPRTTGLSGVDVAGAGRRFPDGVCMDERNMIGGPFKALGLCEQARRAFNAAQHG